MFQGFYNLASGMLSQSHNLNVVSNNMVNVSTPGYKSDTYTSTTFRAEMMYRMGNVDKSHQAPIGVINMARVDSETITNFEDGTLEDTDSILDFAIQGPGYFKVAAPGGGYAYTRNGSFLIDEEGYLYLRGIGRVQGAGGDIQLDSDNITSDSAGGIYYEGGDGEIIDNLQIVDFADYNLMEKGENSTFTTAQEELEVEAPRVFQKKLETSNVNTIREMSNMITSQRSLQSAAQVLKMYDLIMGKAVTEIGKV